MRQCKLQPLIRVSIKTIIILLFYLWVIMLQPYYLLGIKTAVIQFILVLVPQVSSEGFDGPMR